MVNINCMTFAQLRTELANAKGDVVRERIIRQAMFLRYQQHLKTKNKNKNKQLKQIQDQNQNQNLNFDESSEESEDNINIRESFPNDVTNNCLMDRLNNDIELRNFRK